MKDMTPLSLSDAPEALFAEDDAAIERTLDVLWMERGASPNTLASYRSDLRLLARWLASRGVALAGASESDLRDYLTARGRRHAQAGDDGREKFSARSQARLLSALRRFYRFQLRDGARADDPTAKLRSPRLPRTLPKTLEMHQVDALLEVPDTATSLGLREESKRILFL